MIWREMSKIIGYSAPFDPRLLLLYDFNKYLSRLRNRFLILNKVAAKVLIATEWKFEHFPATYN